MTLKEKIALILNSDNLEKEKYSIGFDKDVKSKNDYFLLLNSIPYLIDKIIFYKNKIEKYKLRVQKVEELNSIMNVLTEELSSLLNMSDFRDEYKADYFWNENLIYAERIEREETGIRLIRHAVRAVRKWQNDSDIFKKDSKKIKRFKTYPKKIKKLFSSEDLLHDNQNIEEILAIPFNKTMYAISSSYFSKDVDIVEYGPLLFEMFYNKGIKIFGDINYGGWSVDLSEFNIRNKWLSEALFCGFFSSQCKIKMTETKDLLKHLTKDEKPFLLVSEYRVFRPLIKVPSSITFNEVNDVKSLGEIEHVNGNLEFRNSMITCLGNLKRVEGSFSINNSAIMQLRSKGEIVKKPQLMSLGNLEYVGCNLKIQGSSIESLGKLTTIKGHLNLRQTNITDLSNVKEIGGNLYLSKKMKGIIKYDHISIGNKVRYFNT